jgi:hypothetical protein
VRLTLKKQLVVVADLDDKMFDHGARTWVVSGRHSCVRRFTALIPRTADQKFSTLGKPVAKIPISPKPLPRHLQ